MRRLNLLRGCRPKRSRFVPEHLQIPAGGAPRPFAILNLKSRVCRDDDGWHAAARP
jgi:hypothetical protein